MPTDRLRKFAILAIKLALSVAAAAYVLSKVDLNDVAQHLASISVLPVAGALGLAVVQGAVGAFRWLLVANALGCNLRARDAMRITWVGLFANQILPASLGADLARVWLSHRTGVRLQSAIHSVLIDRFANLCVVTLIGLTTLPFWFGLVAPSAIALLAAFYICILGGIFSLPLLKRFIPPFLRRWRALALLDEMVADLTKLIRNRRAVLGVLATAACGQVLLAAIVSMVALALGISLSVGQSLVVMPLVVILTSIPVSIAGWGVRELILVATLDLMGVPNAPALALSATLGILGILVALPGGAAWITSRDHRRA